MASPDANHETASKAPSGRPPPCRRGQRRESAMRASSLPRALLSRSASMPRMQSLNQLLNS